MFKNIPYRMSLGESGFWKLKKVLAKFCAEHSDPHHVWGVSKGMKYIKVFPMPDKNTALGGIHDLLN